MNIKINMMKNIKFEEEKDDRISSLPDCLVVEILLRLQSTKEAIKTSTLSKRWKHVWTFIPTLDFTNDKRDEESLSRFFSSIDKTLNQCSSQLKLNKFQLHTIYDVRLESQLNNWIRHAINRKVEHLNLSLPYMMGKFVLDQFFFTSSCFTHMKLTYCTLNPAGAISWKNLKSLHILGGKLDEDLIANILSGSPLLETLNLKNCFSFSRLDITSKSVKNLGLFGIRGFPKDGEDIFEINAPNILSLTIEGVLYVKRFYLLDVSSLIKAKLTYHTWFWLEEEENEKIFKRLILNLAHVKELSIWRYCSQDFSRLKAKGFGPPLNMKVLLLDDGPKGYED